MAAYDEFVGEPIDRKLVDYHTIRFSLTTPLATVPVLAQARPGVDLIQYLCWYHVYSRCPIQVMAHGQGVELEAPVLPEAEESRATPLYDDLAGRLAPDEAADGFDSYAGSTAHRTAVYLQRLNQYGRAFESDDVKDINDLLGTRHNQGETAAAALEDWVADADPGADADLLRLFYRRCMRQECLLEPVLGEFTGAQMQLLD